MSIRAVAWVSDEVEEVTTTERCVLYFLADKAREHGGKQQAWPSVRYMADRLGVNYSTVQRAVKSLEKKGVIRRGDQALATSARGDRKPVVWTLG